MVVVCIMLDARGLVADYEGQDKYISKIRKTRLLPKLSLGAMVYRTVKGRKSRLR